MGEDIDEWWREYLRRMWPRLVTWYGWFNTTQVRILTNQNTVDEDWYHRLVISEEATDGEAGMRVLSEN